MEKFLKSVTDSYLNSKDMFYALREAVEIIEYLSKVYDDYEKSDEFSRKWHKFIIETGIAPPIDLKKYMEERMASRIKRGETVRAEDVLLQLDENSDLKKMAEDAIKVKKERM